MNPPAVMAGTHGPTRKTPTMPADVADALIRSGNEINRLRTALQEIADAPFSMVNDSESLRHSIRGVQQIARAALSRKE